MSNLVIKSDLKSGCQIKIKIIKRFKTTHTCRVI